MAFDATGHETLRLVEAADVARDWSAITALVSGDELPTGHIYLATFAIDLEDVSGRFANRARLGRVLGDCGVCVVDGDAQHVVSDLTPETLLAVEIVARDAAERALERAEERDRG